MTSGELSIPKILVSRLFFFNDTATTEIYTLSLHAALPISSPSLRRRDRARASRSPPSRRDADRKSTRLNSSHGYISYAVFCLEQKTTTMNATPGYITDVSVSLIKHRSRHV